MFITYLKLKGDFNPRSRVGSDFGEMMMVIKYQYFNPRSRVGSDDIEKSKFKRDFDFNPRSRVGSDFL